MTLIQYADIIQYADNTLYFWKEKKKYLKNIRFMWDLFEWASGAKVNKEKTKIKVDRGKTQGL